MSKVFIPQLPFVKGKPQDVTDASRFGELVVVFHPEDPSFKHESYADNTDERLPAMMKHAKNVLENFDPRTDYLALSGAPFFIAICMWVLGCESHVRVLRYDRVEKGYYSVLLS